MIDAASIDRLAKATSVADRHLARCIACADEYRCAPIQRRARALLRAYGVWLEAGRPHGSGLAFAATCLADHIGVHAGNCAECSDHEANLGDAVADVDFQLEQEGR